LACSTERVTGSTTTSAAGATSIASGASELATGLREGAEQVPATDADAQKATAEVVAEPVTLSVEQANRVDDLGQIVATFLVPLGLWLGALATFLVLGRASSQALASSASDGRLVWRMLGRASSIAIAQALLLVALLHLAVGVDWALLPATVGFAIVTALGFTAFHQLLTLAFGRGGLVVSLLLLAVQVASTGGLYPVDVLAAPFEAISPLSPLAYAVSGMQSILSGGASWALPVIVLAGFGGLSALLSLVVMRRSRTPRRISPEFA
jgi:putative membrane protein